MVSNEPGYAWDSDTSLNDSLCALQQVVGDTVTHVGRLLALQDHGLDEHALDDEWKLSGIEATLVLGSLHLMGMFAPILREALVPLIDRLHEGTIPSEEVQEQLQAATESFMDTFSGLADEIGQNLFANPN